jgi:trans-aconitate methyltransferase
MPDEQHYVDVAQGYESAFFYESGPYQDWLLREILAELQLQPSSRLADVGGGTGNFTAALAAAAQLSLPALCVDNAPDMLAVASTRSGLSTVCADALTFSARDGVTYDRCLLKEVVHHIPSDDFAKLYTGIACQLAPGGLVLTVTRPQEVDYPLFAAARQVWRDNQPPVEQLLAAMEASGLNTRLHSVHYQAELPKERWFAMIRARFWSTFSKFSDAELEAGVAELAVIHAGSDVVSFREQLLLLVGVNGSPSP